MVDAYHPSVSVGFIIDSILKSGKVIDGSMDRVGNTTSFVTINGSNMYRRLVLVTEIEEGEVNFEQATALAFRFGFAGNLLQWLETEKQWKEGAYIVPAQNNYPTHNN